MASITMPETVKSIGIEAFSRCESFTAVRFLGAEPAVGDDAFNKVSATAYFPGGTSLSNLADGKWQGMEVVYVEKTTREDLRVCASLPDGYEFNGMASPFAVPCLFRDCGPGHVGVRRLSA